MSAEGCGVMPQYWSDYIAEMNGGTHQEEWMGLEGY
jgi:hypothetical protein